MIKEGSSVALYCARRVHVCRAMLLAWCSLHRRLNVALPAIDVQEADPWI